MKKTLYERITSGQWHKLKEMAKRSFNQSADKSDNARFLPGLMEQSRHTISKLQLYRENWRRFLTQQMEAPPFRKIGGWLNQLTGYEECERLRMEVQRTDEEFTKVKEELRRAKTAFDNAVTNRSNCQKELNLLLQRKQSWSDEDLHRFTELYRQEMRLEQNEAETKLANQTYEKIVDEAHQRLMDKIRERYQQEQLWSDKIRRISTYGTFSLMFLNVFLFIVIQLWIEPRKRRRLLEEFHGVIKGEMMGLKDLVQSQIDERGQEEHVNVLPTIGKFPDDQLPWVLWESHPRLVLMLGGLSTLGLTMVIQKISSSFS